MYKIEICTSKRLYIYIYIYITNDLTVLFSLMSLAKIFNNSKDDFEFVCFSISCINFKKTCLISQLPLS